MNTQRTPHVALLVETSLANGRGILSGVSRFITAHEPWSIYVDERKLNDPPPNWLEGWDGHGVIMRAQTKRLRDIVAKLKVPTVDTLNHLRGLKVPAVIADHQAVAQLAVDHLLERQFRHFAFVGVERALWSIKRRDAVVETLRAAGQICHVYSPLSRRRFVEGWEGGQQDLAIWLRSLPKPIGVIAAHDLRALCVLDACRRDAISVPEQVAVIGVDNDEVLCNLGDPPLSSVKLDGELIGYEAASLLKHLMNGKKPPAKPILIAPMGVVTRRSTDTIAIPDALVAKALRFVQQQACSGAGVEQIAEHCGVSRRHIERNFIKFLGASPNEHILRVKLARAKQLLSETDFALDTVANKSGFTHAAYLNVIFRKHTGLTPGEFRKDSLNGGSKFSGAWQRARRSS